MGFEEKVSSVFDVLCNDPVSEIYQFLHHMPSNDFEYLQMWFDYYDYSGFSAW